VQERNAVRATYDDFLQRYTQTVQQQSLPITEARVITPATIGEKTSPKALIVFAGSILLGGLVGFGLALGRDLLDRTVRTAGQVERITGAPSLGLLPKLRPSRRAQRQLARSARKRSDSSPRRFSPGPAAYSVVLASPASSFAETLREVKVASEKALNGLAGVVGVISSLPGEGRTTVAVNLARLIAQGGSRVLFIDCDLRNPTFSQNSVPPGTPGALQAASGQVDVGAVIWTDPLSPLHFMPGNLDTGVAQPQDVLASPAMSNLLRALRQHYDMIIVDLPPIVPFADVQASADLFDGFIVVAEWGRLTEEDLAHGFQKVGIAEKVIGVVLNKVDETKIARFIDAPAVPVTFR
jgi:succinoglycan biosynthesis transport protein ExoP